MLIELLMQFTAFKNCWILNSLFLSDTYIYCLKTSLRKTEIYDFIKSLIREYVWLSCCFFLFCSPTVLVPKNFSLCTHIIWEISNTISFSHSCFRYATNCSCTKLIFFSQYGEKQGIQKRKQNRGNFNCLHSNWIFHAAKCYSLVVTTLLLIQCQIL